MKEPRGQIFTSTWQEYHDKRYYNKKHNRCNSSTFLMTDTCPKYPAVPLSIKGMSAAKHIRFTWFRAAGGDNEVLSLHLKHGPLCNNRNSKCTRFMATCEYLGYPKRSSPAHNFWRTPRYSRGWCVDTKIESRSVSNKKNRDEWQLVVTN